MQLTTTCESCVFAESYKGKQIGCQLNRLEMFDKEVVNGFYVLKGICNACRNSKWAENKKDLIEIVKKEMEVKVDVLFNNSSLNYIDNAIAFFQEQQITPTQYMVFLPVNSDLDPTNLFEKYKVKYQLTRFLEELTEEDQIYHMMKRCKGEYCLILKDEPIRDYLSHLNRMSQNRELFALIENPIVVSKLAYHACYTLSENNFIDKIKYKATSDLYPSLIKSWNQILA